MSITDKYDVNTLDRILNIFLLKKQTEFIFPDLFKKDFPELDVSKIEMMLIDIAIFNSSIVADMGTNNMYRHQFKKGAYLSEFIQSGGFERVSKEVQLQRNGERELRQLQRENLEAGPEAVRVAAEANRLSHEANEIAHQNKRWSAWNTLIATMALVISIIALLRTLGVI